jgi:hypothetical protein
VPELNDLRVSISERQFGRAQGGPIDLSRTDLCRAGLDQATLVEANLAGAVLIAADLSDARLDQADLRGADLSTASLAYATLHRARLHATILDGADLSCATGLTQAQIGEAQGDRHTVLPAGLSTPRSWLHGVQPEPAQYAAQPTPETADQTADPYATLELKPGASMQEVRAAWRRLVKTLYPEGWVDESPASERLKAINQAYQRLKNLERNARQRPVAAHAHHRAKAAFAIFFFLPVVTAALLLAAQNNLAPPDPASYENATREATTPPAVSVEDDKHLSPTPLQNMSYANADPPSDEEPSVAAADRLR